MIELGLTEVLWSALLVVLAIGIAIWWKIPVHKEMTWGSIRSFVQLVAVGYALKYIFDLESPWLMHLAMLIMTVVGAHAASSRVKEIPRPFVVTFLSIGVGSAITIGLLLVLKVITLEPRYVIPLAGMVISNSMNAAALTINRVISDVRQNRDSIETALALGKSWREASRRFQKDAAVAGMLPTLNFLKTVGIVALPGAMTGMILAGIEPIKAVLLQIVVAYMLLAATTITSVLALELTVRKFFTAHHQLTLRRN
jgi:putative ABC transport system permease protein